MSKMPKLARSWRTKSRTCKTETQAVQLAVSLLARVDSLKPQSGELNEQPFDRHLLSASPLFRRSRKLYLEMGGRFQAKVLSSPRSLSSPTLLDPIIQYTPSQTELLWAATDPGQKNDLDHLQKIRSFTGSLFHEQNHRMLWKLLPPPPKTRDGIRRFLHFAESLVIATDMALGDELGQDVAGIFYVAGGIYDPGSDIRKVLKTRRDYRNYLQAAAYATYLLMEMYPWEDILRLTAALHPNVGELAERAVRRAGRIDDSFIEITNPVWQAKHWKKVHPALKRPGESPLVLPEDPRDNRVQYLLAEKWFETIGL